MACMHFICYCAGTASCTSLSSLNPMMDTFLRLSRWNSGIHLRCNESALGSSRIWTRTMHITSMTDSVQCRI
jgi:hypothetical protein